MIIIKPLYLWYYDHCYLFLIINRLFTINSVINLKNNKDFSEGEEDEPWKKGTTFLLTLGAKCSWTDIDSAGTQLIILSSSK